MIRIRILLCALCAAFSLNATAAIPASEQAVAVEFYHAQLDHYFITADPKEINDLDTGVHKGWTRTGYRFSVMKGGSSYAGTSPVCRFYSPSLDTHFYSAKKSECDEVKEKFGNVWTFEADEVFRAFVVDPATGICGADTTPTYRLYNNRPDANHRYTDQISVFVYMKGKSYIPEGDGSPALPIVFCTPSGGDVVPVATESAPSCTVTANSSTPAVGTTLNLNATCTNSPTSFMWQGCTSTTSSCTSTKTASGSASYTLYAANAAGPGDPVTLTVNWGGGGGGGGGGAVPICTMSANTITPNTGATVTLTASCNNSPASYNWVECNYLVQSICNAIPTCSTTAPTCNVTTTAAGYTRHGVNGKNAAGSGPAIYLDMYWTGSGGGGGGGGGGGPIVPVCAVSATTNTPAVGSTITLTATCSGSPTSYDWIGLDTPCTTQTCQATSTIPQQVTYGVSGINGNGTGGRAYTGVNWIQTTPQVPTCTLSPSNPTPSVGQNVVITATCTNGPILSYTWTGCTSTTASCTDSSATPGVKAYQLVATNAAGNSPQASASVNWQPLPTAAPVCTLTSSSGAVNPFTGTSITLTAACTNSPASYTWSGCTSTTSTCTTTSANPGAVTYGVTATNVIGTSPQATVQVTWDQTTGGANYCGPNTSYIDIPWGSTTRYTTSSNGGFPQGKVFVFSITVPSGGAPAAFDGYFAPAEYQGPPAYREMVLSENLCDFSGPYAAGGTSPFIYFDVGAPMVAGKTYYFNLRNTNCSQSSCDMSVTVQWPHN